MHLVCTLLIFLPQKVIFIFSGYLKYHHIRNYYLSISKTFQDGSGNGNFEEINSNDFLEGNWESMEIKGRLRGPRR